MKVSLVIITQNEEQHIRDCILSAKDTVDEIIVVDNLSTDKTQEIAEKLGAQFYKEPFRGFGEQKRYAVSLAKHDWILSLDADERLSEELQSSIIAAKKATYEVNAFYSNRLTYYCGKAVRYSGWYPDKKIRFWNRNNGNWNKDTIHEKVEINQGEEIGFLHGDLLHYSIDSIADHIDRINTYSDLQAKTALDKSKLYLISKMLFKPTFSFISIYFFRLGMLDGFNGLLIATITAMGKFWMYAKALEMKKKND